MDEIDVTVCCYIGSGDRIKGFEFENVAYRKRVLPKTECELVETGKRESHTHGSAEILQVRRICY